MKLDGFFDVVKRLAKGQITTELKAEHVLMTGSAEFVLSADWFQAETGYVCTNESVLWRGYLVSRVRVNRFLSSDIQGLGMRWDGAILLRNHHAARRVEAGAKVFDFEGLVVPASERKDLMWAALNGLHEGISRRVPVPLSQSQIDVIVSKFEVDVLKTASQTLGLLAFQMEKLIDEGQPSATAGEESKGNKRKKRG